MFFVSLVEPLFDHEKLDVYGLELQFVAWIADFFDDVSRCSVQRRRELFEQLDRPSSAPPVSTLQSRSALSRTIGFAPVKRCPSASW